MNRNDYRRMQLAGTITFPATQPRVALLSIRTFDRLPIASPNPPTPVRALVVTEHLSPKVTMRRTISLEEVRAVFIPKDPRFINSEEGTWLLGPEIAQGVELITMSQGRALGIAYVPETSPTLMHVDAGLTAAESAQYYPPLPGDRSANPYDSGPVQGKREVRQPVKSSFQEIDELDSSMFPTDGPCYRGMNMSGSDNSHSPQMGPECYGYEMMMGDECYGYSEMMMGDECYGYYDMMMSPECYGYGP
ncbi:MAG: hypothetical protein AAFX06_03760 [Planctomycetota bacterium]